MASSLLITAVTDTTTTTTTTALPTTTPPTTTTPSQSKPLRHHLACACLNVNLYALLTPELLVPAAFFALTTPGDLSGIDLELDAEGVYIKYPELTQRSCNFTGWLTVTCGGCGLDIYALKDVPEEARKKWSVIIYAKKIRLLLKQDQLKFGAAHVRDCRKYSDVYSPALDLLINPELAKNLKKSFTIDWKLNQDLDKRIGMYMSNARRDMEMRITAFIEAEKSKLDELEKTAKEEQKKLLWLAWQVKQNEITKSLALPIDPTSKFEPTAVTSKRDGAISSADKNIELKGIKPIAENEDGSGDDDGDDDDLFHMDEDTERILSKTMPNRSFMPKRRLSLREHETKSELIEPTLENSSLSKNDNLYAASVPINILQPGRSRLLTTLIPGKRSNQQVDPEQFGRSLRVPVAWEEEEEEEGPGETTFERIKNTIQEENFKFAYEEDAKDGSILRPHSFSDRAKSRILQASP